MRFLRLIRGPAALSVPSPYGSSPAIRARGRGVSTDDRGRFEVSGRTRGVIEVLPRNLPQTDRNAEKCWHLGFIFAPRYVALDGRKNYDLGDIAIECWQR